MPCTSCQKRREAMLRAAKEARARLAAAADKLLGGADAEPMTADPDKRNDDGALDQSQV